MIGRRWPGGFFALWALAALGCYKPQLGDRPFICRTDDAGPKCPNDYGCVSGVCVHNAVAGGVDAGTDSVGLSCTPDPSKCPDRDVEPNDTPEKATLLNSGESTGWAICTAGDRDYFWIKLAQDTQVRVLLAFEPCKGSGKLDVLLFGGDIAESAPIKSFADESGRLLIAKAETASSEDDFYLKVYSVSAMGGPNFYDLDVRIGK